MYCSNCGAPINEGDTFCSSCGTPVEQATQYSGSYSAAPSTSTPTGDSSGPLLSTDRSLLMYIVLSIVTCGIYSLYFLHKLAADLNVACAGDGEETPGLLKLIVFSLITCGIYTWYWYYKVGNRLASNAPRYNMTFQENGTTVLLWMLLGSLICGVGSFVAMYIIIKNTNAICNAYNEYVTA